ncbi:MAG: electron transport complex subunit RsxB [Burkholderiales bacterium]|nr:electron transport complex subunit RsxB [Burkholderiales bacterium]
MTSLADRIDALLPQTQCTRCGYPGCRPYAEAIAAGAADLNQCPPGGAAGIVKLADLLGRAPKALNPANGVEKPLEAAVIDEARCIGCTLCIQACPVDAILGAAKQMHTVLASWCTGCELCVAPCPVDCIAMVPVAPPRAWTDADAATARARYHARNARLADEKRDREARLAARSAAGRAAADVGAAADDAAAAAEARKKAIIAAAMERARAQRAQVTPKNVEPASDEVRRQIAEAEARRARLAKERT